jgi:general L-amino acid transport system substrate-binding protein
MIRNTPWGTTIACLLAAATALATQGFAHAGRLDDIKARGSVTCAILVNSAGQSMLNDKGEWTGFSVDYCRAFAAAVFGDGNKVDLRAAPLSQHLAALKAGELDVLSITLTDTMNREIQQGFRFVGPTIFSGLTFMVPKALNATSVKDLDGATICLQTGSLSEEIVPEYFRSRGMSIKPLSVGDGNQIYSLYDAGRCDAVTTDRMTLVTRRMERKVPEDHVVLDDYYAKSYTGPVVTAADDGWLNIAKWTHYALVTAEELGVTQANVDQMKSSGSKEVRRFLGVDGDLGSKLGLRNDFAAAVIKAVGNYGEIWDRNLGAKSPMKIPRGQNALPSDGGMMFAPSWQ